MTQDFQIEPGTLYIVSTPIGNLKDITLRAVEALRHVDLIAAEDTRKSRILLEHYGIKTVVKSYYSYNEKRVTPQIIADLHSNRSVALICDAGTPGISDPAYYLIREAISAGIKIAVIPGVTAFVPALNLSGLPSDRFVFEGFLPTKKGRQKKLQQLAAEPRTILLYESPKRISRTLTDLLKYFGDRRLAIVREITKKFEQVERGSVSELIQKIHTIPAKGEFVLVVEGLSKKRKSEAGIV